MSRKNLTQEIVTQRFDEWQKAHPGVEARRLDVVCGIPIEGVKYYYILTGGFILTCTEKKAKILLFSYPSEEKKHYATVRLVVNGKKKPYRVNRLILEAYQDKITFIPDKETSGLDLSKYDAHHIENKMIDLEKYKNILSDMTEKKRARMSQFYDNSVATIPD